MYLKNGILKIGSDTITVAPSVNNEEVENYTFSSSASGVASVDSSGVVTGVSAGSATITVTGDSGEYKTVSVTVTQSRTVRFYKFASDAEPMTTVSVTNNGTVGGDMPSNPTDTDYVFKEWNIKNTVTQFTSATEVIQ